MSTADVVIIGGGIVGTSAAAFLAEAGASVVLIEERGIAAGASGRNSGSLQHPFHPLLGQLYHRSLDLYREMAALDPGFVLPPGSGLILVSRDGTALQRRAAILSDAVPELRPRLLDELELRQREPAIADGIGGIELRTGHAVVPAAATHAFARRAQRAGARIIVGERATPAVRDGAVGGVRLGSGVEVACGQVLIAAGPWTPRLVPGWAETPPIVSSWGVVVSAPLPRPPTAILEEVGIDSEGSAEALAFSLVTAGGSTSVGSTFLARQPDAATTAERVIRRARRFVPALAGTTTDGVRSCARPVSRDGLPFVGPLEAVTGMFVCAGHGPWGLSAGPASAAIVVDSMLGRPTDAPALKALGPSRWTRMTAATARA